MLYESCTKALKIPKMMTFDLEALENSEEQAKAVMRVFAQGRDGRKFLYWTEVADEMSFKQMYFPSINKVLHAEYVGQSPAHVRYFRYVVDRLSDSDFQKIDEELTESGWERTEWDGVT